MNVRYSKAAAQRSAIQSGDISANHKALEFDRLAVALLHSKATGKHFTGCAMFIDGVKSKEERNLSLTARDEVDFCLEHPAELLQFAAEKSRGIVARFLFESKLVSASQAIDRRGESLLLTAAWNGDVELAKVRCNHF